MDKLLEFLHKYRHWFVFLILETIALVTYLSGSLYSRSLGWYATSAVFGRVNELMTEGWSYVGLRPRNEELLRENARLRTAYTLLARQMQDAEAHGVLPRLHATDSLPIDPSAVIIARVVNRVTHTSEVYYTINKGRRDGIETDMGVMSASGVVGAVMAVSDHYALVIPVLNPKIRLACTLLGQEVSGTLTASSSPNANEAILSNVPPHAHPQIGDTITTSGYSYLFPEGMMVGTIADSVPARVKGSAGTFANYPVHLSTDFQGLRYVYVIREKPTHEVRALEDSIRPNE
ncbi:MAG: rod shape-determining protein MreC [Porphyromonadaceae bacterium]|uniref:rod shape-determining protein MreC n=1 Tax=Porphyromonas sp. TaxID=1924944 RepID=UPI001CB26E0A|nr:rod shape-determining protein MreC [Porphyromonas sp.]MBF1311595.1 rod shape-determining protein MreC [Porphyromonadaceae bacterium]MBF1314925.1 rod shape-determining protein MreC [Porphyromonadaceae bacterium]MBF1363486.1 rod shape-determining protein MreC [Porphyromonadaceae bacterium]MBF1376754.1 rod shape-determining protein MreC [Porphyromonadaceae bacterium]MBF1404860.1 rod shape-determining protein MreC [Porphyromonas sp.]